MNYVNWYKSFLIVFVLSLSFMIFFSTIDAVAQPECGDGVTEAPEECDDNNIIVDDGCSDICTIEPGYFCDNESGASDCRLGCEITVVKDATPPYDTEFDFLRLTTSIFLPPPFYVFNEFTLTDPSSPQTTFSVPVLSLTFLAELPPDGWGLDIITCGPDEIVELQQQPIPPEFEEEFAGVLPGNLVVAVCKLAGSATCTYENSADPDERFDLTVSEDARLVSPNIETANRSLEDTQFPFRVTAGELDENFALFTQESETMLDMPISTIYTITQDTPEGWTLEDVLCEGSAEFDTLRIENAVVVEVFSPGDLDCRFFNTRPIERNVPTLSQWGLIITVLLIGMAGVLAYRKRFHQSV